MDSVEELCLVQGMTAQIMYGNDRKRNGKIDAARRIHTRPDCGIT